MGFRVDSVKFAYGPWGSVAWRLGVKYPMLMLNRSRAFFIILPFYYFITFPFTLLLMYLDYVGVNTTGTGLIVVARKP